MSSNKWLVIIVSAVVLGAVIAAFVTIGSPARQRQLRFDAERVNDMQAIQGQIVNYWQRKAVLPKELDDLTDSISGFTAPTDPQTGAAYEYVIKSGLEFELCANFNLSSKDPVPADRMSVPGPYPSYQDNWNHPAGRVCFTRAIDPELYRNLK